MKKISKAVYKETGYVALWTVILSAVLQGVFLIARRWTGYILLDNAVTAYPKAKLPNLREDCRGPEHPWAHRLPEQTDAQ